MEVKIVVSPAEKEMRAVLYAPAEDEAAKETARRIADIGVLSINGYRDEAIVPLKTADIFRVYSEKAKVYAETVSGTYLLRARLYEMEKLLGSPFVRISSGELVNSEKILCFSAKFTGTICVVLENGRESFVSRRQMPTIKRLFGLL